MSPTLRKREQNSSLFEHLLVSVQALVLTLCLSFLFSPKSIAASAGFEDNYAAWVVLLDRIDAKLATPDITQDEKQALRFQLEFVYDEVIANSAAIQKRHSQLSALLDVLGDPTQEEDPNPQLFAQYLKFSAQAKKIDVHLKKIEFIKVRADNLKTQLSTDIQTARWERLIKQNPLPLFPGTWSASLDGLNETFSMVLMGPVRWVMEGSWWEKFKNVAGFASGAFLVMILTGIVINRMALKKFAYSDEQKPSFQHRLFVAVGQVIGRSAVPCAIIVGGAILLLSLELVNAQESAIVVAGATNLFLVFVSIISCQAFFVPRLTQWRVLEISDTQATKVRHLVVSLVLTLAISGVFSTVSAMRDFSASLDSVLTFIFGGLLSTILLLLFKVLDPETTLYHTQDESEKDSIVQSIWSRVRVVGMCIVAIALIAAAFGYSSLSKYILVAVISTGVVLAFCLVVRALGQEIILSLSGSGLGRSLKDGEQDRTHKTLVFVLSFSLDVMISIFGAVVVLSLWGVPPEELFSLSKTVVNGFQIGDYSFSLLDIGIAIVVFIVILMMTRTAQWIIADKILPQTRVDIGVRHSIKTGTGYIGLIFGGMIAVSVLGIDLSNLAIVAGALSVGIGFGLQTMVNNFISGLILLIERPIKVGDWVVVGDKEGHVKHINVRATEITTFQRATIIIPNSEILSGSVVNWTHKDVRGRVEVPIGVSYDTDPEKVKDILLDCARDHAECLSYPEPKVIFMAFGASSLDFELRFFVRNVDKAVSVRSDMHFIVSKAMKREGIEIPFPQRVIHMAPTGQKPDDSDPKDFSPLPQDT